MPVKRQKPKVFRAEVGSRYVWCVTLTGPRGGEYRSYYHDWAAALEWGNKVSSHPVTRLPKGGRVKN